MSEYFCPYPSDSPSPASVRALARYAVRYWLWFRMFYYVILMFCYVFVCFLLKELL